jgi:hypothetical protein
MTTTVTLASRKHAFGARVWAVVLLASFAAAAPAQAAERYVSPTGSDAGGNTGASIDNPLATITQAISLSSAGDTIWVRGGTYNLSNRIQINNKSGAAASPYQLFAYPGETPVLDFRTQALGQRGIELNSNYWHVKGLTVQYAGDNGVFISGSNNTLELLTTRQNNDSGVQISTSSGRIPSNNLVLNVDSYGNYDYQGDNRGENADGFAVKFRGLGPGNVLRGVRAWNNSDDGFDFWQAENGVTVENSWAFHNGRSSLFTGVPGSFNGDGNGVKLGHDSSTHLIQGMLVWGHPANGIDVNGNATELESDPPTIMHGVTILNNTALNNSSRNFRFDENPTTASPPAAHILRNNIAFQGGSVQIDAGNTHDHNSWNAGVTTTVADFVSVVDPLAANGLYAPITDRAGTTTPVHATGAAIGPRLANGSLPVLDFMRLRSDSDLINAGVNVGLPFSGAAPDLGAFEYVPPIVYDTADFNHDQAVNGLDLGIWSGSFPTESGAVNAQGDADADGDVDGGDFLVWQQQLNAPAISAAAAGVPEPAGLAIALVLAAGFPRRRAAALGGMSSSAWTC